MSPGLYDSPPGIFSTDGIIPTRLIGSFNSETAFIIPSIVQPPHLSNFISSIFSPDLSEIPPVSNVTALPTRTIGLSFLEPWLYSKIINLGSFLLPCPTDVIPPNPFFFNSGWEIILHFILFFLEIVFAKLASVVGVHSFGGKLAMLLVNIAPSATIWAVLIVCKIFFDFETMIVKSGELSAFSDLNLSNL